MTSVVEPDTLNAALELAVRAPSVHNSQPWRFRIGASTIELWADPGRQLTATDPDGRDLLISCGAALHHVQVALTAPGYRDALVNAVNSVLISRRRCSATSAGSGPGAGGSP